MLVLLLLAMPGTAGADQEVGKTIFLVDESDRTYTVPTVPIDPEYLEKYELPTPDSLELDSRLTGKVKWYVKPIVFGGSATADDNVAWITHASHRESVRYWNSTYRRLKESGA